jgi:hypothetical protein
MHYDELAASLLIKHLLGTAFVITIARLRSAFNNLLTPLITRWSRVLLEKLMGLKLVKKFPAFYGTQSSLPHSQVPTTFPYLEPAQSSPYPHIPLSEYLS